MEQRSPVVVDTPLLPDAGPGTVVRYSRVGLMLAGLIVERLTGQRLDEAVRTQLTEPLGLRDTGSRR